MKKFTPLWKVTSNMLYPIEIWVYCPITVYSYLLIVVVEFCRLPNGAVPEILDEYLNRVAVTGVTVYVFQNFC